MPAAFPIKKTALDQKEDMYMKLFRPDRKRYMILAAFTAFVVLMAAACGQKPASAEPAETQAEASESAGGKGREFSAETEAAEAEEETKEESAAEAPDTGDDAAGTEAGDDAAESSGTADDATTVPSFVINRLGHYEFDDESEDYRQLSEVEFDCIYLTDEAAEAFPALDRALCDLAEERIPRFKETSDELRREMESLLADGMPYYSKLYMYSDIQVHRADAGILSWLGVSSMYYGGAHGDYSYFGENFDAQTGKELVLSDIVKDLPAMADEVISFLLSQYDEEIFFEDMQDTVRAYFEEEPGEDEAQGSRISWTLEPDSITFWFSPYEIAPYASGIQSARIAFEDAPELFTERVSKSAKADSAMEIPFFQDVYTDIGHDGTVDKLEVWSDMNEYGEYTGLHVMVNGKETVEEDADFFKATPVLIHAYDHDILLVDTVTYSDYRLMYIFDLRKDGAFSFGSENFAFSADIPKKFLVDTAGSWRTIPADISRFDLVTRYDVLSTLSAIRTYSIGAQDILIPEEPYYRFDEECFPLTAKQDLKLDIVDEENGEIVEEGAVLASGTELHFFRTDNETWTDMKDGEGNIWRITIDQDEDPWPRKINGVELEECFDGVMYAG